MSPRWWAYAFVVVGVRVVVVRVVVVRDVVPVAGAGFFAVPAETSVSAGCAAVSRFASWMSLLRAESAAAVLSFFTAAGTKKQRERQRQRRIQPGNILNH